MTLPTDVDQIKRQNALLLRALLRAHQALSELTKKASGPDPSVTAIDPEGTTLPGDGGTAPDSTGKAGER